MSYTPTEWESTDVVTATRMNALETAVGDMNMSYTPNTWSDGDILSAEKMNALEQAVASGGGGSSDIPTFKVTVINNSASDITEADFFDGFQSLFYVTTYGSMVAMGDISALTGTIYAESEKEIVFTYKRFNGYISIPNNPSYSYSDLVNIEASYDEYYNEFTAAFESLAEIADASMTITIS